MHTRTIGTDVARQMVAANALRSAAIVGQSGGWSVILKVGTTEKPLGSQRGDKPRTWVSLDTCMKFLMQDLRILYIDGVDATNYSEADVDVRRRPDAAMRMRHAHKAAAYDEWFHAQVQASIDDPRPSIPNDAVKTHFAKKREALRKQIAKEQE